MEKNSLIQGTNWLWRKSIMNVPMHSFAHLSGNIDVKELCLIVDNSNKTEALMQELKQNNIPIQKKEVHQADKNIPEGSIILYMRKPNEKIEDEEGEFEEASKNIQKLKDYIYQNGGTINGQNKPSPSKKVSFNLFHFLTGGRK